MPSEARPHYKTRGHLGMLLFLLVSASISSVWIPAARATDIADITKFGARCDGKTDDSPAINATFDYVRTQISATSAAQPLLKFQPIKIVFPAGVCLVLSTLNWTGLQSASLDIDATGTTIYGKMNGRPIIDALGSKFISLRGLTIQGDGAAIPSIGIQIGRINTTALDGGGSGMHFTNVGIFGYFSLAGLYNLNGEVDQFDHIWITNYIDSPQAFALIEDGINHFGVTSAFVNESQPADSPQSFEQNLFIEASINCTACFAPIWMANASKHHYIDSYISNIYGGGGVAVILYGSSGTGFAMLDMDLHVESGQGMLNDIFLVGGTNPAPSFVGFHYRTDGTTAVRSVFKLDSSIKSATLLGSHIEIGAFPEHTAVVFNEPAKWKFSGLAYAPAGPYWNLPRSAASGIISLGGDIGGNAQAFGSGLVEHHGVLSVSLPTPLNIPAIVTQGSVAAFTVTAGTFNIQSGKFPVVSISSPGAGTLATASVKEMSCTTPGVIASGGTGYQVGDVLTVVGGNYKGSYPCSFLVGRVGIKGSLATGFVAGGALHPNRYISPPAGPIELVGGHGTGATLAGINWNQMFIAPTAAGSGYAASPAVEVVPYDSGMGDSVTTAATVAAQLTSSFSATAGKGLVALGDIGTVLGTSGTSGAPVISQGAMVDGSGVRVMLSQTSYHIPPNTSLVRLTQTSTVTSATLALPPALSDGQPIQFVNYAGAIRALTFSPAVNGWTNGSTLTPYTGLRVRWDAIAAAWYREQ